MMENFSPKALWPSFATNTQSRTSRKSSSNSLRPTSSPRRPTDMSQRNIGIVYRKELREALLDSRTLISTLIVPLFLFPILTPGLRSPIASLVWKAQKEVPKVMLRGGQASPAIVAGLKKLEKIE